MVLEKIQEVAGSSVLESKVNVNVILESSSEKKQNKQTQGFKCLLFETIIE